MPVYSPHPVETNIYYFRTFWEGGYRSYAHLADIIALRTLGKMVTADPKRPGLSPELFEKTKEAYFREATIKKIDSGGGMIHGDIMDFAGDKSGKLLNIGYP
jgi:hemerythrin